MSTFGENRPTDGAVDTLFSIIFWKLRSLLLQHKIQNAYSKRKHWYDLWGQTSLEVTVMLSLVSLEQEWNFFLVKKKLRLAVLVDLHVPYTCFEHDLTLFAKCLCKSKHIVARVTQKPIYRISWNYKFISILI